MWCALIQIRKQQKLFKGTLWSKDWYHKPTKGAQLSQGSLKATIAFLIESIIQCVLKPITPSEHNGNHGTICYIKKSEFDIVAAS